MKTLELNEMEAVEGGIAQWLLLGAAGVVYGVQIYGWVALADYVYGQITA